MITINEKLSEIVDAPPSWLECKVMANNCSNCGLVHACNALDLAACKTEGHIDSDFAVVENCED